MAFFWGSGVLFGSRAPLALRWTTPGMILGEVALRSSFTWRLSLPTWGVNVDGLACPLRWHKVRSYHMRGHGLSARRCLVFSLQCASFAGREAPWA
jgi:hypothetical protein